MFRVLLAAPLFFFGLAPAKPTVYTVLDLPETAGLPLHAPVGPIHAGAMPIILEHTTLTQVKQRFGGNIQAGGDASEAVSWLCYRATTHSSTPIVYWFASNAEMSAGLSVSQVAVQLDASPAVLASCDQAPASLNGINSDLPEVGATADVLTQRFGPLKPDARGFLVYSHERPLPHQCTTSSTVDYRLESGSVKLFAISQVSSC